LLTVTEQKAQGKATFDFLETLGHLDLLNKFGLFEASNNTEQTRQWQALSIAALICYSRPFLKSYKLESLKEALEGSLTSDSKKSAHQKFLARRNQLIAHSDGDGFEIQVVNGNPNALSLHAQQKYLDKDEAEELRLLASDMLRTVGLLRAR
jgi:hypothetical protein